MGALLIEEVEHHDPAAQGSQADRTAVDPPGAEDRRRWVGGVVELERRGPLRRDGREIAQGLDGRLQAGTELPAEIAVHAEADGAAAVDQDDGRDVRYGVGGGHGAGVAHEGQGDPLQLDELLEPIERVGREAEEDDAVERGVVAQPSELARQVGGERLAGTEEQQGERPVLQARGRQPGAGHVLHGEIGGPLPDHRVAEPLVRTDRLAPARPPRRRAASQSEKGGDRQKQDA